MISRARSPGRLHLVHTPPGLVRALGAITLVVDLAMAGAGVALVRSGHVLGVALVLLGATGVLFALGMLLGRREQVFTRDAITQTWFLGARVHTRAIAVADVEALVLTRTYRRVKESVTVLEQLHARGPALHVALLTSDDARFGEDVEAIARLLERPVRDERVRDVRKMVSDTQARARPVALAAALVLVCVAAAASLTIALAAEGAR